MTTQKRTLTFKQRNQLRRARQISNRKFLSRPSKAREKRVARFQAEAQERRALLRELDAEARAASQEFKDSGLTELAFDDRRNAVVRSLMARGMTPEFIFANSLDKVSWDNRALKALIRKWENMQRKGWTRYQIETELERRLFVVQRERGDPFNPNRMLELVREFYGTDLKGRKRVVSHLRRLMPLRNNIRKRQAA